MGFCTASKLVKLVMQYQYMAPVIKATWIVSRILFAAVMSADALGHQRERELTKALQPKGMSTTSARRPMMVREKTHRDFEYHRVLHVVPVVHVRLKRSNPIKPEGDDAV